MKTAVHRLMLAIFLISLVKTVVAETYPVPRSGDIEVCPGALSSDRPPDFGDPSCRQAVLEGLSTHRSHRWVRTTIDLPADRPGNTSAWSLIVMGKASSRAFVNGVYVGANGIPADSRAAEKPGKMDTAFPIPKGVLRAGMNELVFELSGHYSTLDLANSINFIAVSNGAHPADERLRHYWPSLIPLGAILIGAIYYASIAIGCRANWRSLLVSAMSFFVAFQLIAEVWRGILPYAYWIHDFRLIAILANSIGFGTCLLAYVVWRTVDRKTRWPFTAGIVGLSAAVLLSKGFDEKAAMAILVPSVIASSMALLALVRNKKQSKWLFLPLAAFSLFVVATPSTFLDSYFYFVVAVLLGCLFAYEGFTTVERRALLATERTRANQLQLVLDRHLQKEHYPKLKIRKAGRTTIVNSEDILYCKGAGDYVEIVCTDNQRHLHDSTLATLEKQLPAVFLRVHRSYIVNTTYIRTLERDNGGSGRLSLTNHDSVPVSRRILPKVRQSIS